VSFIPVIIITPVSHDPSESLFRIWCSRHI